MEQLKNDTFIVIRLFVLFLSPYKIKIQYEFWRKKKSYFVISVWYEIYWAFLDLSMIQPQTSETRQWHIHSTLSVQRKLIKKMLVEFM